MQTAWSASRTNGRCASTVECTATVRTPRRLAVRMMRRAISPRLAISTEDIMIVPLPPADVPLHPENAEARLRRNGAVQRRVKGEAEDIARLDRIDDAVVPETRAGVGGVPFALAGLAD